MKKTIAMLLTFVFILTCALAFADEYRIGIIQMADNGAFTDMREGFMDRMRELGYTEDEMTFTYRNALGDMTQLVAHCEAALDEDIDAAVTIATPPTQAFCNLDSGVPQFFISVRTPETRSGVSSLGNSTLE